MSYILGCTIDYGSCALIVSIVACTCTIIATCISIHESRCNNKHIVRITKCSFTYNLSKADGSLFFQFENIGLNIVEPKVKLEIICGNMTWNYDLIFIKHFGMPEESEQITSPDIITRRIKFNCKLPLSWCNKLPINQYILQNSQIRIVVKSNDWEIFSFLGYNGKEIKSKVPQINEKNIDKYIKKMRKKEQRRKKRVISPKEIRFQICLFRKAFLEQLEQNPQ